MCQLSSLDSNSFVHQSGEVSKVIGSECPNKLGAESIAKPLLLLSISGDILNCITRESEEIPLIILDSLVALDETTEFGLLAVQNTLRDVTGAESSLEVSPSDDGSFSL